MALRTWLTAGAKTRSGRTFELIEEDERQPMTLSASTSRSTGERPNNELENAGPYTSTSPVDLLLLLERISLIGFLLNILCFSSLLSNNIF